MSNHDNSIINSLKRLERAGSESSRTTEKLREAAAAVAESIIETIPLSLLTEEGPKGALCTLPRGYVIEERTSSSASFRYLSLDGQMLYQSRYFDALTNHNQGGDFHCWIGKATRDEVLKFAADIANGLLDEIAAWLEARTGESVQAQRQLDYAASRVDNTFGLPSVASDEEPLG